MNSKLDTTTETIIVFLPVFLKKILQQKDTTGSMAVLTPANKILLVLDKTGPISISEMGKKLCISKPNMTPLIDFLIEEKLVDRTYDKIDRRIIHIELTEKGKKEAKVLFKKAKEIVRENLAHLTESELNELENAILTIKSIFSKVDGADTNGTKK